MSRIKLMGEERLPGDLLTEEQATRMCFQHDGRALPAVEGRYPAPPSLGSALKTLSERLLHEGEMNY